ncbi:reverse transcriptase domain-containing protein [Tanacetum coccineum]
MRPSLYTHRGGDVRLKAFTLETVVIALRPDALSAAYLMTCSSLIPIVTVNLECYWINKSHYYRERRPENITLADWDAQIAFWNDPTNQAQAAQNCQNRAKSMIVCQQGSRSLARLRDEMMESSATREYPSLIRTFFMTHIVNGVFTRDKDRAIYVRGDVEAAALGSNTPSGVPYTNEEINALARKGKQRGYLPGVGRVLPGRATTVLIPPPPPPPQCTHNSGDVEKLKKKNKYLTKQVNLMMKLFRSNNKFSQMLNQYESTPEFGNGSGGCGDDEMADDEDDCEDEEDEEDGDS